MVYLDNAASTKPSDKVIAKVNEVMKLYGNPSSVHTEGWLAKQEIINAKHIIAEKLHCNTSELNFTSGATMSNNLFIQGFLLEHPDARLIISTIEHNDIMKLADHLDEINGESWVYRIGVDHNGLLNIDELTNTVKLMSLTNTTALFCIQWANGECGVIQDMKTISDIIHSYDNMYLYTDATQYIPHFSIDLSEIKIDGLGMSGQKINCIKGVGLMYVRNGIKITPIIWGEQGLIGGTENVIGIAALGSAFEELDYDNKELYEKRDFLINELSKFGDIIGDIKHRLPNNICITFTRYDGDSDYYVALLNELGICASSGSACSSGNDEPSHVVLAMGYSLEDANSCIRFTLSKNNTVDEIHEVITIVNEILNY